jgi:hypothetical protein
LYSTLQEDRQQQQSNGTWLRWTGKL